VSPAGRGARPEPGLSEFEATPIRIVVHDPSTTNAFDVLAGVPEERLTERTLFRAHPDRGAFAAEHAALVGALRAADVPVVTLSELIGDEEIWDEVRHNPNHVYTRDSAITIPWLPGWYIGAAMRAPIRRPEPPATAAALRALGLRELFSTPTDHFLEGGDVIPLAHNGLRALLVGFGPRSTRGGIDVLCERLMPWALDEVVGVELAEWRMNLDGVLVPVADDTVVAHPGSIEAAFVRDGAGERPVDVGELLRRMGMTVIEVTREESMEMQACNCLCLGNRRMISYDLAPRVLGALRERGIEVTAIPGSELIKGTGGPRCMTRPIYG
jgi:N-dimethylarginine dimethylaminohydrolase